MSRVNFIFCLHNHQPVDNFDPVFARACEDSYFPFLERMERHPNIRFAAHYSGPLLEWLQKNRIESFLRLRKLVDAGRLELVGGGFFEPVFTMLPDEDAAGQIAMMGEFLTRHFGAEPAGAWLPERVWEQTLVPMLAKAGVKYGILDDFHFRAAGIPASSLTGHFLTEDRGSLVRLFPIHEELRYAIPYKDPQATIDYLLRFADESGERTIVYADDGEKFGLWPNTKKHVYDDGWLDRFLDALDRNADRIRTITFRDALKFAPVGRVYLPSASYREMGEWSLPAASQAEYEGVTEELRRQNRFDGAKHFFVGGTWRNFRVKYPEANLMYGRMLSVSQAVRDAAEPVKKKAAEELYRGQCNCGYWHGVFGGLYLPHLRGSVYRHLIEAENILEKGKKGAKGGAGYKLLDLDLDGREDVRLHNDRVNVFVTPASGGQIVEFDSRDARVNLVATLARRREHYHSKIRQAATSVSEARSIHDVLISRVQDPEKHLVYDTHPRASLVDHFFEPDATLEEVSRGSREIGDFATAPYTHEVVRRGTAVRLLLRRDGTVRGIRTTVEKEIVVDAESPGFEVKYTVKADAPLQAVFAVEFNVAMLSPTAPDAEVLGSDDRAVGSLTSMLDHRWDVLRIRENWYGLFVELHAAGEASFWTYPVQTVSQSESGLELTYQSTAILPHWKLDLAPGRPWSTVLSQKVESRRTTR